MDTVALDTLWMLLAGVFVFFMQAGFSLVEVGFTRAKNAGNIMMKNYVDFMLGSIIFWVFGYTLMYGSDMGGFIGSFDVDFEWTDKTSVPGYAQLFFQTVFAATAATIVSGAMAGRTKFSSYIIVSIIITSIIYPIEGHWIWGGGWLSELGFHDFAGSTVVHSVGGWAGLMGAIVLGPRIGKYIDGKPQAIPGHNLILGGFGVFVLWLGWFGFNPGSELAISGDSAGNVAGIFITTNLAAAGGAMGTMFTSWIKYKKPDLSMTLNGALAGLVAITAGCAVITPGGALIVGILAGILVLFSIEFIDKVLKVDDPVGAVSVHGVVGAFGTLMVGFFGSTEAVKGLFYGGGGGQIVTQLIGIFAVAAWTIIISYIMFRVIKATMGLRVSKKEEIEGLDVHEHGQSVYN